MAKKKEAKAKELKEVSRQEVNGVVFITYEDGSVKIIPAPITLTKEQAEEIFGSEEDEDEDDEDDDSDEDEEDTDDDDDDSEDDDSDDDSDEEDEDDDEEDDEDEDEVTPESLAEMDFEELEDLADDKELDVDPDDYEEEDVEKLRKAIAKELGITLPKKSKGKKK